MVKTCIWQCSTRDIHETNWSWSWLFKLETKWSWLMGLRLIDRGLGSQVQLQDQLVHGPINLGPPKLKINCSWSWVFKLETKWSWLFKLEDQTVLVLQDLDQWIMVLTLQAWDQVVLGFPSSRSLDHGLGSSILTTEWSWSWFFKI